MSSSLHASSKTNNILVLGEDFVQGINGTILYAEKLYSINFTENNKKKFLNLHYNGVNSYLFVNDTEIHKSKAKITKIVPYPLCLGNVNEYIHFL